MPSRLGALAAYMIEAAWLAALVVVPAAFNVYAQRTFEADKVTLLRSLALWILCAACLWVSETGSAAVRRAGRPVWRTPLVGAAAAVAGTVLLSTVCSVSPRISFWGSYDRGQGAYTWFSYIAVFTALVLVVRTRRQVERIVTAVLLGSVPVVLYALVQWAGADPIGWGFDVRARVHGTIGGPIFLGGYLVMVLPLTLARLLGALEARRTTGAALYAALLGGQGLALIGAQSRGPVLGCVGGVVVFALALRQRFSRRVVCVLAAAGIVAVLFVSLQGARLARVSDLGEGSGRLRVLTWQGAAALIGSDPARAIVGYGPDTMGLVFGPFAPPELGRLEARWVLPDRAHNAVLDTLISDGVIGLLAEGLLVTLLLMRALRGASGLGAASGGDAYLCAAIAAAVVAHVVEVQVGFATTVPRLLLWVYAGLVAVLPTVRDDEASSAEADDWLSVLVALVLIVLTFDLVTPTIGLTSSPAVIVVLLGVWVAGALFAAVEADGPVGDGPRRASLPQYAAVSVGVWTAYVVVQQWWIRATPAGPAGAEHLASLVVLRDGALFALIGGAAVVAVLRRRTTLAVTTAARWRAAACLVVLGIAAYVALRTNVDLSRADAASRQAFAAERQRRWDDARQLYEVAQRWQPGSDRSAAALARPLMELARTAGGSAEREGFYVEARAALERAQRLNPLDADHVRNLARLDRLQASAAADGTSRAALLVMADGRYARLAAMRPNDATLWTEWALLCRERDDRAGALAKLDHAAQLDDRYASPYWLRGQVRMDTGEFELALADFERAVALDPRSMAAWGGKAAALRARGRVNDAITATRAALALEPEDFLTHRSLALLYAEAGQLDEARRWALSARARVGPEGWAELDELVARIDAARATPGPGR